MAQIIIEVPDEKLSLVVDAVNSKVNPNLAPSQVKFYTQEFLSRELREFVWRYQMAMWINTFVYDDPVIKQAIIAPRAAGVVVSTNEA